MEERLAKTRAKSQIYKSAKDKRYAEEVISKNGLETINSSNKREVTPTKKKVTFITSDKHKNWQGKCLKPSITEVYFEEARKRTCKCRWTKPSGLSSKDNNREFSRILWNLLKQQSAPGMNIKMFRGDYLDRVTTEILNWNFRRI